MLYYGALLDVDLVHCRCFAQLRCIPLLLWLLPIFYSLGALVEKQLILFPRLEVGRLLSPLADVVVEHPPLFQKGDPFGHHHGVVDCLAYSSRELSPLSNCSII